MFRCRSEIVLVGSDVGIEVLSGGMVKSRPPLAAVDDLIEKYTLADQVHFFAN